MKGCTLMALQSVRTLLFVAYGGASASACVADLATGNQEGSASAGVGAGAGPGDAGANAGGGSVPICGAERGALLDALRATAGPCESASDCGYFTAWAAPGDAASCNGDWPIAALDDHRADLNAKNQALADCQTATGTTPSVGTCDRLSPAPVCDGGICRVPGP
jgi:hypothetical protein